MTNANDHQKEVIRDSLEDAETFAHVVLRLPLHEWQGQILEDASPLGTRRRMAVRAPNGAGKDDRIIAPLVLWWLRRYAKGQVVITTKDEKQLNNQTWVSISAHKQLFGDCRVWRDHDHTIITPTGGRLVAYVTDEASRAEGYHERKPDGPLLMIINEAREVDDGIFKAFGRCSYNLLLEISTGGLKRGKFYEHFTKNRGLYQTYAISLKDCPHISKEKVDQTIEEFGEDDPYTRSTIYGEFMDTDSAIKHVFELSDIESNRAANIGRIAGGVAAGIDFAAGGDLNTLVKKDGNWVEPDWIHGWPQRDTYAAVGRFIDYFHKLNLEPRHIWADADGLGIGMCDHMDNVGWRINRFHGGSKSPHPRYKNLISYVWHEVATKVRRHQINVPNHQELIAQLSSRQIKWSNDGKLWLESKEELRNRGVSSPDYADAFCMAHGIVPFVGRPYGPIDSNWGEISRRHGWQHDFDNSEEYAHNQMYGESRLGRSDDGGGLSGFGGIGSEW